MVDISSTTKPSLFGSTLTNSDTILAFLYIQNALPQNSLNDFVIEMCSIFIFLC